MSWVALDSENHILRDEITHAKVLAWGRFAKIIPMSDMGFQPKTGKLGGRVSRSVTHCQSSLNQTLVVVDCRCVAYNSVKHWQLERDRQPNKQTI